MSRPTPSGPPEPIRKRVYVVGCYRSGTTLLESLVACHPQVTGFGFETTLFTHVVPRRPLPPYNAQRWAKILEPHCGVRSWSELPEPLLEAFDRLAARLARERGASVFVEKTPFHLFHVERILALQPEAKFLHVVRDGRDVVTSVLGGAFPLERWRHRRGVRLLAACALWEWMVFEGLRVAGRERTRFHTVRYEDLVREPRRTLEGVAGFLGLETAREATEAWLDGTRDVDSNSSFEPMRGISKRPVGRWRDPEKLQPSEADLLDRLLGPTLSLLGYPTRDAPVPALREWRARTGKLLFALMRVARFSENTGYRPPRHAWRFVRQSLRASSRPEQAQNIAPR